MNNTIMIRIIGVTLLAAACSQPAGNTPQGGGKSGALQTAVTAAEALLGSVAQSTDGAGLSGGQRWVMREDYTAFETAIAAANAVLHNTGATQAAVDEAISQIEAAKLAFELSIYTVGLDKTALAAAIYAADTLLRFVEVSVDGAGLPVGAKYTSQAGYDAFRAAFLAAGSAYGQAGTPEAITVAVADLAAATAVFESRLSTKAGSGGQTAMNPRWTFDENPAGWTAGDAGANQPFAANYGMGMTLLGPTGSNAITGDTGSGRSMGVYPGSAKHADIADSSPGKIRIGGDGTWAKITGVHGPYTLKIYWQAENGSAADRWAAVKIGTVSHNIDGSMQKSEGYAGKILTVEYDGADKPDIYLKAKGGIGIFDVIITGTGGDGGSVDAQPVPPTLVVDAALERIGINEQRSVNYAATGGGEPAAVIAVSSAPAIVRVDSAKNGAITVTGLKAGSAEITVSNAVDGNVTQSFTVAVLAFPASDDYGALGDKLYPAAGAINAYTDGELAITFDAPPVLDRAGTFSIYDQSTGELVDRAAFTDERQTFPNGGQSITLNVKDQLARVDGNTLYLTPHFGKLEYGKTYYVAIPGAAVSGVLNGKTFNGLSDNRAAAAWSFTTRAAPVLDPSAPVTVNGARNVTAHFRTLNGALRAIAARAGDWTINIAPGVYYELIFYQPGAAQNLTINGTGTALYGEDVLIRYKNGNSWNAGTGTRASFFIGGNVDSLVLKNCMVKNLSDRSAVGQAETLHFNNRNGTAAVYNCGFYSYQDTLLINGRAWFYKCYVEGAVDYIWGYADACLFEECEIASIGDGYIIVSRFTPSAAAPSLYYKGFVIFNSTVLARRGATWLGRGHKVQYDQAAVIDTGIDLSGGGTLNAGLWDPQSYGYLGAGEHVGFKVYGLTDAGGAAWDTGRAAANTSVMTSALYNREYNGRDTILNRVYNDSTGSYEFAPAWWDLSALETAFNAGADASKSNAYAGGN
jgi:hypothetical protein